MTEITQERDPWARVPFWLLSAANPTAVVVYAALARYANMPEGAIPSIHRVASDLGMSYRTVQRAVNDLEEAGAVVVEHRFADGNEKQRLPSRYHLLTSQPDKSVTPPVTSDATPPDMGVITLLSPVSNEVEEVSKKKEVREAPSQSKDRNVHGTRLPEGFVPSEASRAKIREQRPDLDLRLEHENFCDFWVAKPGRDGLKLDWDATWRKWMRGARGPTNGSTRPVQAVPAYVEKPAPDRDSLPWREDVS